MGLQHLTLQTAKIETPGGVFAVRGLSLDDIVQITREHSAVLASLIATIRASGDTLALEDMAGLAGALFQAAPRCVHQIIALAEVPSPGEPKGDLEDLMAIVRSLAFPIQLEALEKIGALTFTSEGSVKKALETVIKVVNGATQQVQHLRP